MAQNPQRIFGDIANQATKRDRETFEQWYLQTYQQKFSWEALFAWKEANKFGLTYKRKKNIKYNEGLGANGQVFNTDDNLLKYSTVEFEDGIVELDTILTFARKLDPVESDFNPNLWAADIEQAMDTEVAYKRNKILEIINKGTVTTIQGQKANDTNALQIHDEIMDKIYENGFTPSETVVLGSADFIRGIRNKLQLQLGANDQINSVIETSGAMKTVEGTTYYMVPKKLPIINKDGSEGTIELLPNGVNAIAFKFSKKYDPLILRKKDHTPLRVGAAALGTGMGNTLIMERVLYLGGAIVEPKGIIKHIVTKIDISKINKIDKPTIHVADPTQATPEQLKPQFKDVVLKAVKIVPLSVAGEVALTIYYKNPQYVPIVVMTTLIKAEQFVLALEPFKFYMHSEWFIGWGFKKTSLFNLVSFAPLAYQQVVKDSFKIYRTIAKVLKLQEQFKNNFNKDKLLNTLEDSAVTSLLGNGLVFQAYKQLRTKQDLNKTIIKNNNNEINVPFDNKTIYYENNVWKAKQGKDIPTDVIKDIDLNKDYIDKQNDKYIVKTSQDINLKQDKLVSGTNIKTINGNSLLGSGDISISNNDWEVVNISDFKPNDTQYILPITPNGIYKYKVELGYLKNKTIYKNSLIFSEKNFDKNYDVVVGNTFQFSGLPIFTISISLRKGYQNAIINLLNQNGIKYEMQTLNIERKRINSSNNTELMADEPQHSIYKRDMDIDLPKETSDSYDIVIRKINSATTINELNLIEKHPIWRIISNNRNDIKKLFNKKRLELNKNQK